jgi:hypothetical protein
MAITPEEYKNLKLPDQWIEDLMQEYETKWIMDKLDKCNTVLELGYGSGIIANALVKDGKSVTVVDGAPCHVNGAQCIVSMFEDYAPPMRYGCVIASFVLEHVENPLGLLRKMQNWGNRLIVVGGNAGSIHRRLAVQMGIQDRLDSLSARDEAVGHYRVYDIPTLRGQIEEAGWKIRDEKGFFIKPLPNSMMTGFSVPLLRAMNEIELPLEYMANVGFYCE